MMSKPKSEWKYRSEWKYQSDEVTLSKIRERVGAVLDLDSHASETGKYAIHSLYFDDHTNSCARENVDGEGIRFKYRIRYYGDSSDYIFLEKKEKKNSFCHKRSCKITPEEFWNIVEGNVEDLLWEEDRQLLKEFAVDIVTKHFEPKVIISYERIAFVELISNIRITFDTNIVASNDFDHFLDGTFTKIPVIKGNQQVLEVKFDDVLPAYVAKVIQNQPINQQSFSKYYMGRMALQKFTGLQY